MSVLLIAEIENGRLSIDATSKALSAALQIGKVAVLCAGSNGDDIAKQVAELAGIQKVLVAPETDYDHCLAEPMADLIIKLAPDFSHIIAPSTSNFKNIMPRVAALLDVMIIPDVIQIIDAQTFDRPIYAGNAIQTIKTSDPIVVATIRTSAFDSVELGNNAPIETLNTSTGTLLSEWVEDEVADCDRPELTSAQIVVSGGRGVGSKENFAIIEQLADKLGAAVGASRAAVDAGYVENDLQVGQTGKIVAPELYIAVGISGAIQHLAGMKDSKIIVAINKDEDAPIFQVADYGLAADLFEALPDLTEKL